MNLPNASRGGVASKRLARVLGRASALTLLSLALGCGSETPDKQHSDAGSAGSAQTPTGGKGGSAGTSTAAQGGSAGSGASGGSAGQTMQPTGGAGAGGGSSGASASGGSGGTSAGSPPVGGAGAGGSAIGGAAGTMMMGAGMGGAISMAGGAGMAGAAGTAPMNPLADLATSGHDIGLLLSNRFSKSTLSYSSVANLPGDGYKNACEWYGALGVAKLTSSTDLLNALVKKFDPMKTNFVSAMTGGDAHVDRYIYGIVPLEIFLDTGDQSYLPLGTQVADNQQTTNQTRNAIDDMFMMTSLQVQAFRGSQMQKYLDFMSAIMVDYLKDQQANGLFFHNVTEAKVHWGRGNGWFAAGMAEIMRDLPSTSKDRTTIETGYKKMMDGLVKVQGPNGLWYQVLDMGSDPANWEESSGSAMFTYAMISGVRSGILDATTYVPVIKKAWAGLLTKINAQGDVSGICEGTWYKATAAEYMALNKLTGDGHGQAPVIWAARELLR